MIRTKSISKSFRLVERTMIGARLLCQFDFQLQIVNDLVQ
jgi:hypothetical protein